METLLFSPEIGICPVTSDGSDCDGSVDVETPQILDQQTIFPRKPWVSHIIAGLPQGIYIHIYIYRYIYIYIDIDTCKYMYMCKCIYICVCKHVYIYICVCV